MAINLRKGEKIDIGLQRMSVGLGWDPNEGTGHDFDLDASAFLINDKRLISSEINFIYFNNLCGREHVSDPKRKPPLNECNTYKCVEGVSGVMHTGDDPDGTSSDGDDDEAINVDLAKIPSDVKEILFVVTIHDADVRKQNFGQVRNSYIRVVDQSNGEEICKYELDEDFSVETSIEFGRLYRRGENWKFEASGIGYKQDLAFFVEKYYQGDIIK